MLARNAETALDNALLFTDAGLSPAEVSALFVLWSATGIVLEVPIQVTRAVAPHP